MSNSARLLFIWAIFSLFGIQSMAHKVSVRVIARNRAKKYEKEMED